MKHLIQKYIVVYHTCENTYLSNMNNKSNINLSGKNQVSNQKLSVSHISYLKMICDLPEAFAKGKGKGALLKSTFVNINPQPKTKSSKRSRRKKRENRNKNRSNNFDHSKRCDMLTQSLPGGWYDQIGMPATLREEVKNLIGPFEKMANTIDNINNIDIPKKIGIDVTVGLSDEVVCILCLVINYLGWKTESKTSKILLHLSSLIPLLMSRNRMKPVLDAVLKLFTFGSVHTQSFDYNLMFKGFILIVSGYTIVKNYGSVSTTSLGKLSDVVKIMVPVATMLKHGDDILNTIVTLLEAATNWFGRLFNDDFNVSFKGEVWYEYEVMRKKLTSLVEKFNNRDDLGAIARQAGVLKREIESIPVPKEGAIYTQYRDLKNSIGILADDLARFGAVGNSTRCEPVTIVLSGAPGVGKSNVSKNILDFMAKKILSKDAFTEYRRCPGAYIFNPNQVEDYVSGYTNQEFVIVDDLGYSTTSLETMAPRFIQMVNSMPYNVEQAELHRKGAVYFDSSLLLCTSNIENWAQMCSKLTSPDAFCRRLQITIWCECKDEYALPKQAHADENKLDVSKVHDWRKDNWLNFYVYDPNGKNPRRPMCKHGIKCKFDKDDCGHAKMSHVIKTCLDAYDDRRRVYEMITKSTNEKLEMMDKDLSIEELLDEIHGLETQAACSKYCILCNGKDATHVQIHETWDCANVRHNKAGLTKRLKEDKDVIFSMNNYERNHLLKKCLVHYESKCLCDVYVYQQNNLHLNLANAQDDPEDIENKYPKDTSIYNSFIELSSKVRSAMTCCAVVAADKFMNVFEYFYSNPTYLAYLVLAVSAAYMLYNSFESSKPDYEKINLGDISESISLVKNKPKRPEPYVLGGSRDPKISEIERKRHSIKCWNLFNNEFPFIKDNLALDVEYVKNNGYLLNAAEDIAADLWNVAYNNQPQYAYQLESRIADMKQHGINLDMMNVQAADVNGMKLMKSIVHSNVMHGYVDGCYIFTCLGIGGSVVLMNEHLCDKLQKWNAKTITLKRFGKKLNQWQAHYTMDQIDFDGRKDYPDCDLVAIKFPGLECKRIDSIATDEVLTSRNMSDIGLAWFNPDTEQAEYNIRIGAPLQPLRVSAVDKVMGKNYNTETAVWYKIATESGTCGSPAFMMDSLRTQKFVGIHCAGDGFKGAAVRVTKKMILSAYEHFKEGNFIVQDNVVTMSKENIFYGELPPKPIEDCQVIGRANVAPTTLKSEICKSILYKKIPGFAPNKMPAILVPTVINGELTCPIEKNVKSYARGFIMPDQEILEGCILSYITELRKLCVTPKLNRFLTFEESVKGCDELPFLRAINRGTSGGYPDKLYMNFKKRSAFGYDEIFTFDTEEAILQRKAFGEAMLALKDGPIEMMANIFPKDELRPVEKAKALKTRLIAGFSCHSTLVIRSIFGPMIDWFICPENRIENGSAIGCNPSSVDWTRIAFKHGMGHESRDVKAGDYSSFDKTLNIWFMGALFKVWKEFFGVYMTKEENIIAENCWQSIMKVRVVCKDSVIAWGNSNPSGNALTSMINTIANQIILRYSISKVLLEPNVPSCRFRVLRLWADVGDSITITCFGDDNIWSYDKYAKNLRGKRITYEAVTAEMAKIGFTYTDEMKSDKFDEEQRSIFEVSFLKRGFVKEKGNANILAPLELENLMQRIQWAKKSDFDNANFFIKFSQFLAELAVHDEDTYNKHSELLFNALEEVCPNHPVIRSYTQDERRVMWSKITEAL